MRKLFSILLLLVLAFYLTEYYLVFYIMQLCVRASAQKNLLSGINAENIEQFVFYLPETGEKEQPEWKDSNEFQLNGDMYDIVEQKTTDGKLTVRCVRDKKETDLVDQLNDNEKQNTGVHKMVNTFPQFIQIMFYHTSSKDEISFYDPDKHNFHFVLGNLPFPLRKIPSPPPQS